MILEIRILSLFSTPTRYPQLDKDKSGHEEDDMIKVL